MTARQRLLAAVTVILLALASRKGQAQAEPTAAGPGSYIAVGGGLSAFQQDYGRHIIGGGWVFADVQPHWRVGLEGEARYLRLNSEEQVTETNYLGGVIAEVRRRPGRYNPYAKFLAGAGGINLPFGYAHGTFLAMAPGAGLDIKLTERISFRAVDVEYQLWPQFTFGRLDPYGISTGLRIRLTPLAEFPKGRRFKPGKYKPGPVE